MFKTQFAPRFSGAYLTIAVVRRTNTTNILSVEIADACMRSHSKNKYFVNLVESEITKLSNSGVFQK